MKAPRLHELAARVVAWHNRHPLARRIDATQVHSIGEVRLPFASAKPWGETPAAEPAAATAAAPPANGPTLAEALAQRNARLQAGTSSAGIDGLDVQSMLPEDAAALPGATGTAPPPVDLALDAAPGAAPDDGAHGEASLVVPLLDGDDAAAGPTAAADDSGGRTAASADEPTPADPGAGAGAGAAADAGQAADHAGAPATPPGDAADTVYPPPHGAVPASALAQAVERRAALRGALGHALPGDGDPPAPPEGRWRRLVATLRRLLPGRRAGLPPLRAAFSDDFIWPLRPARVARWAQRHGQPQPLAPADWPRRSIDTDRPRLAQLREKGMAHDLPLHVLTAAIGVGDRRIRVLIGADGSILGPRAYHATRVGSLCTLLAIGLVGLGWHLRPLHGLPAGDAALELAAPAASAASAVAAAASTASAASAPMAAASDADSAASATQVALAASAPDPAASQADAQDAGAKADAEPDPPAVATAGAASQPQANIQPRLSEEERYAAKVESARMRGEPIPPPPVTLLPGPLYAVVSPASRQRATAAGSLAKMKAAASRLDGPAPEHGELMESQGQWRAAWWPFTNLVDAERARVLLVGQGLRAEVIEF